MANIQRQSATKVSVKNNFFQRIRNLKNRIHFAPVKRFVLRRPFASFFLALLILFILIFLGSTVFKAKPVEEKKGSQIKQVQVFKIGEAPKVSVQGLVSKSGVVKIVAQMPGIVQSINFYEGSQVYKGQTIINLSTNYQGGNALSLSRQIAQNQYNLAKETHDSQKETIQKQRDLAERTDANNDQLRDIQNRSLDESRQLLDLNDSILGTLNSNLDAYEATNSGGINSALISQTQSAKAQLQAADNQLRQGIRSTEYQSGSDKPPAQLSDLQRDLTMKQLEIQEKSLEVNLQISNLSYQLAAVNEANMYPASPYNGTVEKINVKIGQSVTPGTVLATISQVADDITIDAQVPASIASNVSQLEDSEISVNGKVIKVKPAYVSSEATNGQLYSVIFHLDDAYKNLFTDAGYASVSLPIGVADANNVIPFIPVDSVFQTQEEAFVYVTDGEKAKSKKIILGDVKGAFVEVKDGIGQNDQIILNRNVLEGDQIKVQN